MNKRIDKKFIQFAFQKFMIGFFVFSCFLLFLYSFTQVDLNLTLSRSPMVHAILSNFQHIGFYKRLVSTQLYFVVLLCMQVGYFYFLYQAYRQRISVAFVWKLLFCVIPILLFSYTAFSYDLFNYIFYPKIIINYHQNPYFFSPDQFPGDAMLHYMRWTGVTYPYGPVWLVLTIPLSLVGMGYLIPTLLLFKLLTTFSFLGMLYYVQKILKMIAPERVAVSMVFIGLSPLVLIESIVSAHNDIVMLFLAVASLYYLLSRKYTVATVLFILSVGVKFATVFALPVYFLIWYVQRTKNVENREKLLVLLPVVMSIAVFVASYRTNFQPWYLLYYLPFAALVLQKYYVLIPSIVLLAFSLLTYAPYIYFGNSNPPVSFLLQSLNFFMVFLSVVIVVGYRQIRKKRT